MLIGEFVLFFFNDTATTEIYTLSLHDALPISHVGVRSAEKAIAIANALTGYIPHFLALSASSPWLDRKSTRLNSSHVKISYAVFCLKKKKNDVIVLHKLHATAGLPPASVHCFD